MSRPLTYQCDLCGRVMPVVTPYKAITLHKRACRKNALKAVELRIRGYRFWHIGKKLGITAAEATTLVRRQVDRQT